MNLQYEFSSFLCPSNKMFGAKTRLIDRDVSGVEEIILPKVSTIPGKLLLNLPETKTALPAYSDNRLSWKTIKTKYIIKQSLDIANSIIIDLRRNSPTNWAHAFLNQLPLALHCRQMIKNHTNDKVTFILPADISPKVARFYQHIGIDIICTNQSIHGKICSIELNPWIAIRGERVDIINTCLPPKHEISAVTPEACISNRIFLSRKDTRCLKNEKEIIQQLEAKGFQTLYLEEHSLEQQIATICFAKDIIAVHGAALGPLILRSHFNSTPYRLTELFSPAHITNCYRVIASQTGGQWAGVRGRLWPGLLKKNANFKNNLENFEVCPESLEHALKSTTAPTI